jgi:hypothetical protein
MRDTTGLEIMAAGLFGALCLLGPSCGSGDESGLSLDVRSDASVNSGVGGATGLGGSSGASTSTVPFFHPEPDGGPKATKKDAGVRPDGAPSLYGITPGTSCFRITSTAAGYDDGCQLEVATLQGFALPGTYDPSTGVFTLGGNGGLGAGLITYNQGTLVRTKVSVSDPELPGCSWNQESTTTLTMTGENSFTASITERQDAITPACGTTFSACVSTWTWTMQIDGTKSAPRCD